MANWQQTSDESSQGGASPSVLNHKFGGRQIASIMADPPDLGEDWLWFAALPRWGSMMWRRRVDVAGVAPEHAQALALRVRIILACAEGEQSKVVAARLGIDPDTVGK
jgi:hypothetical protein